MTAHPPAPQRVAVVINPIKADADVARDAIVIACRKGGFPDPVFFETAEDDPGFSMTERALEQGFDLVLAAGGDGTVRSVAEVLMGHDVPLGLLPLGTGNLLARNLGADLGDPHRNVDIALFGDERAIDMASFRVELEDGQVQDHGFCVMGGAGFDAQIMTDTKDELKKLVGWAAYGEAGVRHLFAPPRWARFRIDDGEWQSRRVRSIMAANCGILTAGMILVPQAKINDGVLDVVVMSPRSTLEWALMAAKVVFRQRRDLPVIEFFTGRKVRVEFHEPIESQVDGDGTGVIRAFESEIRPGVLSVRVPPSQAD
ncbi:MULTISPECIES: diacylglycerol/lipid kinase family protein [Kocuria]|uniref:diacylglycerol/lipid kinase family protein n=1 Tax=Kocuria TaxID=57493 RepID=UPI00203C457E|nr:MULTISPECIES: diacylglycerol kinase family protein [Kocuria]MCM3688045.1 diacylglycerol kinase family lipid kinase [Kocuria rosea]HST73670.1 diacylglycerol kinase family protein [Kocuria rosea]